MYINRSRSAGMSRGQSAAGQNPRAAILVRFAIATVIPVLAASSAAGAMEARASFGVVISAVFADGYAARDADEAVQLWNVGETAVDLGGWTLRDASGSAGFPTGSASIPPVRSVDRGGWLPRDASGLAFFPPVTAVDLVGWARRASSRSAGLPPGIDSAESESLPAGEFVWITRDAAAFARSFGHPPDWAWGDPMLADGTKVRELSGSGAGPTLANTGEAILLVDAFGEKVDTVLYGAEVGDETAGWVGPAVDVYHPGVIGSANQILYRALDTDSGRPVGDTDAAADWASHLGDPVHGRRARFPGWDLEAVLAEPWRYEEEARLEVAVGPDGLFAFLDRHLASAESSIDFMAYTFEHPALAERLAARARSGVKVRVLVDGAPAGGHDVTGRWCLNLLAEAGADVRFMDSADGIRARYRSQHAKLVVIDGRQVLVGTENPTLGSMPIDGTAGRRGVWIATDAPGVATWATTLIARDFDPVAHVDLRPFQPRDPTRGAPAPDFEPERTGGGPGNVPRWAETLVIEGRFEIETVSAPETTRRAGRGVLGLVARAGPGDEVRVAQLREPVWWGGGEVEGEIARNPRLIAYLDAARRGARVRVMLDGYFDDPDHPNSNAAAAAWLRERAAEEGLDLDARTANPTGRGLHAKVILVDRDPDGPERWIHVGSINGTEVASLVNREVALNIRSAKAHDLLAEVFDADFVRGYHPVWLPLVGRPLADATRPGGGHARRTPALSLPSPRHLPAGRFPIRHRSIRDRPVRGRGT